MNDNELLMEILTSMGFNPKVDEDGDINFRYHMKSIYVRIVEENGPFCYLLYPQFYEIEEGEDILVMAACNNYSRRIRVAKTYIDATYQNVSGSFEFYFTDKETLSHYLEKALVTIDTMRRVFMEELTTLKEASESDDDA